MGVTGREEEESKKIAKVPTKYNSRNRWKTRKVISEILRNQTPGASET